jgi:hypothetical protein
MRRLLAIALLGLIAAVPALALARDKPTHAGPAQAGPAENGPVADTQAADLVRQSLSLFATSTPRKRAGTLAALAKSGRADAAPILILALRMPQVPAAKIVSVLERLTGAKSRQGWPGRDWSDWMLWQEAHPEAGTMPGFARLQAQVFAQIDPNFLIFLNGTQRHDIRLEEIAWGGVTKDGIPALTNPKLVAGREAGYLNAADLVFGVEIAGDARAYPLRILDWHEMFNDVIGGVPVSLAYCTLCGSGILFETTIAGQPAPFVFGSSGFLYRSNKLMYDTATHSLWNQFTGRPVVGPLTGSGIELKTRPVVITRWADWFARHPETRVLAKETGFRRNYAPGAAYNDYFSSAKLMFPTNVDQSRLKQKDYVFALRSSGADKAWPLALFSGGAVINDAAGVLELVLVGDAATRTVRAYRRDGRTFVRGSKPDEIGDVSGVWRVTEDALVGPAGESLSRLPGHIAYWFAWNGYLGKTGELATGSRP